MGGEGVHMEVEQHFSGTDVLVLAQQNKHNTVQGKCRNEAEKWTCTVVEDLDHQRPLKPPTYFQKDLEERTVHNN